MKDLPYLPVGFTALSSLRRFLFLLRGSPAAAPAPSRGSARSGKGSSPTPMTRTEPLNAPHAGSQSQFPSSSRTGSLNTQQQPSSPGSGLSSRDSEPGSSNSQPSLFRPPSSRPGPPGSARGEQLGCRSFGLRPSLFSLGSCLCDAAHDQPMTQPTIQPTSSP